MKAGRASSATITSSWRRRCSLSRNSCVWISWGGSGSSSEVNWTSAFGVEKRRGELSENGDFDSDIGRIGIGIFGESGRCKRLFLSMKVVSQVDEKREFRREDMMRGEMLFFSHSYRLF